MKWFPWRRITDCRLTALVRRVEDLEATNKELRGKVSRLVSINGDLVNRLGTLEDKVNRLACLTAAVGRGLRHGLLEVINELDALPLERGETDE